MAFNKDSEHTKHLEAALKQTNRKSITSDGINVPKKQPVEKHKRYTFSLKPSVRSNIEKMAKENNYKSSSELLNTLFKDEE